MASVMYTDTAWLRTCPNTLAKPDGLTAARYCSERPGGGAVVWARLKMKAWLQAAPAECSSPASPARLCAPLPAPAWL